jgi:hypothetical protein
MTTSRWIPVLLLAGALLAEAPPRPFTDEEIGRHLANFDASYENRELPQEDAVASMKSLRDAYRFLEAPGEPVTNEQIKLKEEIVARAVKGLAAKKRWIVNLECARVLGELGDQRGAAPLAAWLKGLLNEARPNPTAVDYGFASLAWIGPDEKESHRMVFSYAQGQHGDPAVAAAAMRACAEWRALDAETRKGFFDGICAHLETLASARDEEGRARYEAVRKQGLDALRELGDGATRFESPARARAWFEKRIKWEKYVGPRFRKDS